MAISVEKKKDKKSAAKPKLEIKEHFFKYPDKSPYDSVEWGRRDAIAGDFRQENVLAPITWSDSAVGIVAKLYFATINGKREDSIEDLIKRVVTKITQEGINHKYFDTQSAFVFENELAYILIHQIAAFNTPVWLNLGVPGRKQCCSACFLLNVEDTMFGEDSITEWWCNEAKIFKSGAGSGVNLSKIRGSMEKISHGGIASGPVSFMRPADANAGTVKSGSVARRAAKLVCLDADHPDILDFVNSKVREDERMRALMAAGVNLDLSTPEGERNIAECTSFQNANISVRLSDEFIECTQQGAKEKLWCLKPRLDSGESIFVSAKDILYKIAEAAWKCADPGVAFSDTINRWHTTPSLGPIETANPCHETVLNNNTSCNLASMNLVKFLNDDNLFRFDDFYQTVDIMITAMDITCSFSDLPTKKIEENTRNLRQLGLGYSSLGAALMIQGMPYDSDEGRDWAASVTSLMTGRAYRKSAELASCLGPFKYWKDNKFSMSDVIEKHSDVCKASGGVIWDESAINWNEVISSDDGFRNSQITVIAPTGTISFMMDCDTTGAEPLYSPITYKKLASGGMIEQKPKCYENSINEYRLGKDIGTNTFQTASDNHELKLDAISPEGHLNMLAAIQPHISGAISKTVNLPESSTVEDIYNLYLEAWKKGIKCLAVYRDGSKATQVLSTKKDTDAQNSPDGKSSEFVLQNSGFEAMGVAEDKQGIVAYSNPFIWKDKSSKPSEDNEFKDLENKLGKEYHIEKYHCRSVPGNRRRMDNERKSITHKFQIGQHEGYITAGMYEDGTLGEIFLSGIGKEGSTLRGMMDAWAVAISMGLQYGVPLETLANKFSHMRFEPEGLTNNSEIRVAQSMPDYIMKWLISKFGDEDSKKELGIRFKEDFKKIILDEINGHTKDFTTENTKLRINTGKVCTCGAIMHRTGTCYTCSGCGLSTGCM